MRLASWQDSRCNSTSVTCIRYLSTTPWRRMEERRCSSSILYLVTRWRWVVSFTPWSFYPRWRSCRCPLDRKLDGPQSRTLWRSEKSLTPVEKRTPAVLPVAPRYTYWALPAPLIPAIVPFLSSNIEGKVGHLKVEVSRDSVSAP
jgi:hypothetical protein